MKVPLHFKRTGTGMIEYVPVSASVTASVTLFFRHFHFLFYFVSGDSSENLFEVGSGTGVSRVWRPLLKNGPTHVSNPWWLTDDLLFAATVCNLQPNKKTTQTTRQ
jgi:hypothetical protein